jgi:hypothetical protein
MVALTTKQPAVRAATVRTDKPGGVEVPLQPQQAEAIIKQIGYWKIDRGIRPRYTVSAGSIPWLHTYWT